MLIEQTLFGKVDKVQQAIDRFRQYEELTEGKGFYIAFSGGKDSCCIKALADIAGVKYDAHYNVTGIDPPELVWFIKRDHPDVIFERPEKTIYSMMLEKSNGFPPMRWARWCCKLLKERGGAGRLIVTGVRWEESTKRKNRKVFEVCRKGQNRKYLHPIIDWTEGDVWEFIHEYDMLYCKLYDEGRKRIGCLMCPSASTEQREEEARRYPRIAMQWRRYMKLLWDDRIARGKPFTDWETPDEMFEWWLKHDGHGKQSPEGQQCFAFDD